MAVQYHFLLADISVIVMNSGLSVNISCHDISAVVLQFLAVGTGRSGHDQQKRSIPLFNVGNYEREERKGTSGTFVEKTLKLLPPVTLSSSAFYTPVSATTHPIAVLALEKNILTFAWIGFYHLAEIAMAVFALCASVTVFLSCVCL